MEDSLALSKHRPFVFNSTEIFVSVEFFNCGKEEARRGREEQRERKAVISEIKPLRLSCFIKTHSPVT